jgi:hypothetical protein
VLVDTNQPKPGRAHPRLYILALLLLCLSLLFVVVVPIPLSDSDIQQITELVQKETNEPILSMSEKPLFRVEVTTGVIRGGFDAAGREFRLRWGMGGWKIYQSTTWFS